MSLDPPGDPGPGDAELLGAVARGDAAALAALFRRHHRTVLRFCVRLAGEDAEDIAQQTFLIAWSEARRFRGGARVTTWLMGIAANLVRRRSRVESRRRTALALLSSGPAPELPSPREAVTQRQLAQRLPAAIARLPDHLRVAYVMCEVEEVPGPEAARVLGVPPGTVWRRLHQARRQLLVLLEEVPP